MSKCFGDGLVSREPKQCLRYTVRGVYLTAQQTLTLQLAPAPVLAGKESLSQYCEQT